LGGEKKSCCLRAEVRFIFDYTKDRRGVDLILDALPFGRLWYGEPNAVSSAISYAMHRSRSHDAVIRVYAPEGSRTVGVWEAGIALGKRIVSRCPEATDLSGRF